MATTVRLQGAVTGDITIRANSYPDTPGEQARQLVARTAAGGFKIARLGQTPSAALVAQTMVLVFTHLDDTDKDSLRDFFVDDVKFAEDIITLTDADSQIHNNMRYAGGLETFQRTSRANTWSGQIQLVKDLSP